MGITINLNEEFVLAARAYSTVQNRSVPKQIEHWAKIGRMIEDNPDLTYNSIKDMLLGLEDVKMGHTEEYHPGLL